MRRACRTCRGHRGHVYARALANSLTSLVLKSVIVMCKTVGSRGLLYTAPLQQGKFTLQSSAWQGSEYASNHRLSGSPRRAKGVCHKVNSRLVMSIKSIRQQTLKATNPSNSYPSRPLALSWRTSLHQGLVMCLLLQVRKTMSSSSR